MLFSNSISMIIHVVKVAYHIVDTIQPREQVIYYGYVPGFDNKVVRPAADLNALHLSGNS